MIQMDCKPSTLNPNPSTQVLVKYDTDGPQMGQQGEKPQEPQGETRPDDHRFHTFDRVVKSRPLRCGAVLHHF